ncbi:MAG: dienelactone hydrolase family protein [Nitrospira sp.]|nr:dienelactone hydrolase family protein [bacterium]MBL7049813.1 dienelactone hydrolase family protein [Nitrospira sp.]
MKNLFLKLILGSALSVFTLIGCASDSLMIKYGTDSESRGLLCRPSGQGPYPAVVYNHGKAVDVQGYEASEAGGYKLMEICEALAADGFMTFVPIRQSGGNDPGPYMEEINRAIDFVKLLPDVDASRLALMGFSRGGMLTLMTGVRRDDLSALIILAPAPGRGYFERAVREVYKINVPVLLMVEASDGQWVLDDFQLLSSALDTYEKKSTAIKYDRGGGHRLFWEVGYYWDDLRSFLK